MHQLDMWMRRVVWYAAGQGHADMRNTTGDATMAPLRGIGGVVIELFLLIGRGGGDCREAVKTSAAGTGVRPCPSVGQRTSARAERKYECRERPGEQAARKRADRPRMVQRLHVDLPPLQCSAFVGYDESNVT